MVNKKRICTITPAGALQDSRAARAELTAEGYRADYVNGNWNVLARGSLWYFATAREAVTTLIGERK